MWLLIKCVILYRSVSFLGLRLGGDVCSGLGGAGWAGAQAVGEHPFLQPWMDGGWVQQGKQEFVLFQVQMPIQDDGSRQAALPRSWVAAGCRICWVLFVEARAALGEGGQSQGWWWLKCYQVGMSRLKANSLRGSAAAWSFPTFMIPQYYHAGFSVWDYFAHFCPLFF